MTHPARRFTQPDVATATRAPSVTTLLAAGALIPLAAAGCRAPSDREIASLVMASDRPAELLGDGHRGPRVAAGSSGPARFAAKVFEAFDEDRAMETVRFLDGHYRAPGNDGYEAGIDHVAERLRAAGYGSTPGFELFVLEEPLTAAGAQRGRRILAPAWTPLAGRVALRRAAEQEVVLHRFDQPGDVDRVMLPVNTPAGEVEGVIALSLDELEAGEVLVIDAVPRVDVLMRAQREGAVAVVSSYLEPYNVDPAGSERHLDAIQFRTLPAGTSIPVAMISPRSMEAVRAACAADPGARLSLSSQVRLDQRPLRTLVARVVGDARPEEAVAVGSHVQEPGAGDNASGVAGLCESAVGLIELIGSGRLERPARSLVFLWGDEFRQTSTWLERTELRCVAGLSSDMTGQGESTGALALLERMPDPGALEPLAPDEHTLWGRTEVAPDSLRPNGLAIVARTAMLDVAAVAGGWRTADHPYEGGSDHDVFIARGIPAALFWHFTDYAYHTSMDRMEMVDPAEMRRTGAAILATALALADPRPADLERYLASLNEELGTRASAAEAAGNKELARRWREWCTGARQWLRAECLNVPLEDIEAQLETSGQEAE